MHQASMELEVAQSKKCPRCAQVKSASEFSRSRKYKGGLHCYCKACTKKMIDACWNRNGKLYHRKSGLKVKFGLTQQALDKIIANQSNKCMCCGIEMDPYGSKTATSAVIDHCHDSGMVRAVICRTCNLLEGHVRDLKHLRSVALYVFGGELLQPSLWGKK